MSRTTAIVTTITIAILVAGYGVAYLICAFLALDWDFTRWSFWGRAAFLALGLWFTVVIAQIIIVVRQ